MRRSVKAACALFAAVFLLGAASCAETPFTGELNEGKSVLLGAPAECVPLSYSERREANFRAVAQGAEAFAADFAAAAYRARDREGNFAVSPVSVYMAMAPAAECAAGETREELLSALGVGYETLGAQYDTFVRSLTAEERSNADDLESRLSSGNSIWLDPSVHAKEAAISALAEKYRCYSYSADFGRDNRNANRAVREFICRNTHGVIDRDLKLSEETAFVILNTLYLKDIWNRLGKDLPFADGEYTFTGADGSESSVRLLEGYSVRGRAFESERYTMFYTQTYNGYMIKFLLPKEGETAGGIFTEETLREANAVTDFHADDDENKIHYMTSCLFPEFKAEYDGDVKGVLRSLGVGSLFEEERCDLSALCDENLWCSEVRHIVSLTVDRKGIEGAAVTAFIGAGAAGPDGYETVYERFVVDRSFGFILTDPYGVTLFSGVVDEV